MLYDGWKPFEFTAHRESERIRGMPMSQQLAVPQRDLLIRLVDVINDNVGAWRANWLNRRLAINLSRITPSQRGGGEHSKHAARSQDNSLNHCSAHWIVSFRASGYLLFAICYYLPGSP